MELGQASTPEACWFPGSGTGPSGHLGPVQPFCKPVGGQRRRWLARVVAVAEPPAATSLALPSPSHSPSEGEIQGQPQQDKTLTAAVKGEMYER